MSANGGKIDVEPTDVLVYDGDRPLFKNGAVIVNVVSVKVEKDEDNFYAFGDNVLLITTKDEKDFPVDFETMPYDTIFAISNMVNDAK